MMALADAQSRLRSGRSTRRMPNEPFVTIALVAAIFLVADPLLAGGSMTMMGMSTATGVAAHPLGGLALIVLIALLVSRVI